MVWIKRVLFVGAIIVCFLFAALAVNQDVIALQFAIWKTPAWPAFWWLLMAFLLGLSLGLAGMLYVQFTRRLRTRRLEKELERRDSELLQLRNAPLNQ